MKKTILLSILIAFMACNKENLVLEAPKSEVDNDEVKVNIAITRVDSFGSTKATVKNAFADDDVVFVFFKGVAAPKYLEMKYNSSTDTWTSTAKNGLTSSDISDAADKKMTAIYLPYGSSATVAASEGNFIFSDLTYSGYFLQAEQVTYTYEGGVLSGTLNMSAPALSSASDKLIHFDVSGFTSGHNYKLYQDYVKPLTFTSVSAEGIIFKNEGTMGTCITGYEDGLMLSFSGILDASAVGKAVDYQFSIDDVTSSTIYTRDAGTKTVSTAKYIGIGAINNSSVWNAFEYVDLGLSVKWAKFNVGATTETGYGDYYAWGETEIKSDYDWSTYKYCNGSRTTLTKYNLFDKLGSVDNKMTLDLDDDVAHVQWGGNWRMPTKAEWEELKLFCNTTETTQDGIYGYLVRSTIPGFSDRSIFIPKSGTYPGPDGSWSKGYYWTNTQSTSSSEYASYFDGVSVSSGYRRTTGLTVRPVFSSTDWEGITSLEIKNDNYLMSVGETNIIQITIKKWNNVVSCYDVNWYSDHEEVVSINSKGVVTACSPGTANITVTCHNKSATCIITVEECEPVMVAVDLGLSVKWATCNVGATSPEKFGSYFAWGETETKNIYNWLTYKYCNGTSDVMTKYNTYSDKTTGLISEDDAAHVKWGGNWRMPTKAEVDELINDCEWTWTQMNGVYGYMVAGKKTGFTNNYIFLPSTGRFEYDTIIDLNTSNGHYWSSTLSSSTNSYSSSEELWLNHAFSDIRSIFVDRYRGYTIRPVCP